MRFQLDLLYLPKIIQKVLELYNAHDFITREDNKRTKGVRLTILECHTPTGSVLSTY